jgi:hypothetical protein
VGRGQQLAVREDLEDLDYAVGRAYADELRPIRAGRAFLLTLVTFGVYFFFVLYRLNRYWWDAQVLERDFDDRLSRVWMTLGFTRYPLTYRVDESKSRSFGNNLLLSFVTLGIWTLVWDYRLHTDPDNLYGELHNLEDTVLQIVRAH